MFSTRNYSSLVIFALGVLEVRCAPRATQHQADEEATTCGLNDITRGFYRAAIDFFWKMFSPSELFDKHDIRLAKRETVNLHSSSGSRAISIGVPLICAVIVITLGLLLVKTCYLKQRRIQTIHQIPILLTALHDDNELESAESTDAHHSTRVADPIGSLSARSRTSRMASKRASESTSLSENSRRVRQRPDSAPGLLVGLLGSPDWETSMQRQLADHQWRQRRAPREGAEGWQFRHSWHSRIGTAHARAGGHARDTLAERRARTQSGRFTSARIPHVSSFGEIGVRESRRRPRSLNAVVERSSPSHSSLALDTYPVSSASQQENGSWSGGDGGSRSGFTSSINAHSQRPSTIREVDTPPSTLSRTRPEATFCFRGTDFGVSNDNAALPMLTLLDVPATSVDSSINTVSSYGQLNTSVGSSIGSSYGQLPNFPSPPATDTPSTTDVVPVNTVLVGPYAMDERSSLDFLPNTGFGLGLSGKADSHITTTRRLAGGPSFMEFRSSSVSDHLVNDSLALALPSLLISKRRQTLTSESPGPRAIKKATPARISGAVKKGASASLDARRTPLSPLPMRILNRHHTRARAHVPFSLVAPPKAHLRNLHPFAESIRLSSTSDAKHAQDQNEEPPNLVSPLLRLSTPVRPSPLRRVASMSSIASSQPSGLGFENLSRSLRRSSKSRTFYVGGAEPIARMSTEDEETENTASSESNGVAGAIQHAGPKQEDANQSLFLDISDKNSSEFPSFETSKYADGQKFEYLQASSSGILTMEEHRCPLREDGRKCP